MKDKIIKNGIEYVRQGDCYIPNLTVPDETEYQIGKYGSLRRTFLKEHHNWLYSTMLMQGPLLKHLAEIDLSLIHIFFKSFFSASRSSNFKEVGSQPPPPRAQSVLPPGETS